MSRSVALLVPPAAEPISLADAKLQLGLGPIEDSTRESQAILSDKVRAFIIAARRACEDFTERAFLTQTWVIRLDTFPGHNLRYEWNGYPEILIPKPPFQSVSSFQYIDVSGTPQTLTQDTTYGVNPLNPPYGYQLERGSETQPGRLLPPFARPWPPTRMVPANVLVEFRCGYGGPLTVSMTASSAVLSSGSFKFNPDDAPLLPTETGTRIVVPGAGAGGADLVTNVASVATNGQATLATAASANVSNVNAWLGWPVPAEILTAIKLAVEEFYDKGSTGCGLPEAAIALLKPYRNLVA